MPRKTTALFILDGFGYSETSESNAIKEAHSPTWDHLWENYPRTLISTSGLDVGLPPGQMGNSEVGHMNLGAGRVVYQNFTRISKSIDDGDFFDNEVLKDAVDKAVSADKAVHILGVASPGGVHGHEDHIVAMIELAAKRGAEKIYLHAFLDGRDTPPQSAEPTLRKFSSKFEEIGKGHIASMIGRYFSMDRDNRWERIQEAYDLLTQGKAIHTVSDVMSGLKLAYDQDKTDEFCPSTSIQPDGKAVTIEDGDAVIFMNFRPDRARELTRALVQDDLESTLDRSVRPKLGAFVMLTEFASDIHVPCAFPPETLENTLGEYLASQGKTQLRIAETEKYPHVTFFFNGGEEQEFDGEKRILIPSPKVATYDLQPEMNAYQLTDDLVDAIKSQEFDLIVCNYANCDMVGHSGIMEAAIKSVEAVDSCMKRVIDAMLEIDGQCLVTADHGNVEIMVDPNTGGPLTSHTTCPVPMVFVSNDPNNVTLKEGRLCDIAPTLLSLMELPQPEEMTGVSLVD